MKIKLMQKLFIKTFITLFSLLSGTISFGQNCYCSKDTILKNIISCDTIKFDNGAKLFWSFNCDSSWLTFENPQKNKTIIFSLGDGLVELTGRLGHIYLLEYKDQFLIQNNVISGCCSPPEFYLYDKMTGKLKDNLGRVVFYSKDKKLPFVISITDSKYNTTLRTSYNSLTIYNIDKDKKYQIELAKGQIEKALKETEQNYPEYLFNEPSLNGTIITLTYYLKKPKDKNDRPVKNITINFKKYL